VLCSGLISIIYNIWQRASHCLRRFCRLLFMLTIMVLLADLLERKKNLPLKSQSILVASAVGNQRVLWWLSNGSILNYGIIAHSEPVSLHRCSIPPRQVKQTARTTHSENELLSLYLICRRRKTFSQRKTFKQKQNVFIKKRRERRLWRVLPDESRTPKSTKVCRFKFFLLTIFCSHSLHTCWLPTRRRIRAQRKVSMAIFIFQIYTFKHNT